MPITKNSVSPFFKVAANWRTVSIEKVNPRPGDFRGRNGKAGIFRDRESNHRQTVAR